MKTALVRLLAALALLTLLMAGVDLLLETSDFINSVFFGGYGRWQGIRSIEPAWLRLSAASAMILLPILTAAAWILIGRDDSIAAKAKDGDMIRLRPIAIERVVAREVKNNVKEVFRVSAEARQGRRRAPAVTVHIAVDDSAPVPQVRTRVRDLTRDVLGRLVGVADTSQIKIVVHDVRHDSRGSRRSKSAPDGDTPKKRLGGLKREKKALPDEGADKPTRPEGNA